MAHILERREAIVQGNRTNVVLRARERLSLRPSPDKGVERGIRGALRRARGTGRLCKGGPPGQEGFAAVKLAFLYVLPPQTPLNPPLSGGKWTSRRFHPQLTAVSCDCPGAIVTVAGHRRVFEAECRAVARRVTRLGVVKK
jgi:hypothetical protein